MSESVPRQGELPAFTSVVFIILTTCAGFYVIGPLVGFMLAIPFVEVPFSQFQEAVRNPAANVWLKTPLTIIQSTATFIGLIVGPCLYWLGIEKERPLKLVQARQTPPMAYVLVPVIVVAFAVMNSFFVSWNTQVDFPDFMSEFERWAHRSEDLAAEVTTFLTAFDSFGEFIVGFIMIAILPAIGEELVFRGMLQPKLLKGTGNAHVAIWLSALLFSAMHMQFFGFVPRVLLGALFGYLYYWSGNLLLPMVAHFINNGLGVLMIYMRQLGLVKLDVQSTEPLPSTVIISGTIVTFGLLIYFKNVVDKKSPVS